MSNDRDHEAPRAASRHIRSFVRREGRLTAAQAQAFERHWAEYGLTAQRQARDLDALFGRHAPRVLEIGFGNGEALLYAAENEPDKDFIGIEVHKPGVGRLLNALAAGNLSNARLYHDDAIEVMNHDFAPASLAEVRIYFPDPWPKQRQKKRRLVQPELMRRLAELLIPGGLLHLATDWADYAANMLAVLEDCPEFSNCAGKGRYSPRPTWRVETHFEKRGMRLGHGVFDLVYRRC